MGRNLCIVPGFLALWAGSALATNGIEPIGVSTASRFRGGADVAVGDSALSQVDNPATLSLTEPGTYRFELAGQVILPECHWRGPADDAYSERRVLPLANLGFATTLNDRWSAGFAVHSKAGIASLYHMRHLMIPFMKRRVGSDMKDVSFSLNLAYKLTDKLSLGVGARMEVVTAEFSTTLGPADLELGRGYAYGGGFQLGLHYQATDELAFGVGYRSPTWMSDISGGQGRASLLGVLPIGLGDANIDEFRLPQRIAAGVAWQALPWFKLVSEVRWFNNRQSSLNNLVVATNGLVDLRLPLPLGYRDQWVFIIGGEFELNEHWTLGLGYNFATNAVPPSHLCPLASVAAQHHITTGLRYRQDNWWIGAGYILAMPATLRAGGHSKVPFGVDYAFSSLDQMQHHVVCGFGFHW